jgi:hypothetical protein
MFFGRMGSDASSRPVKIVDQELVKGKLVVLRAMD